MSILHWFASGGQKAVSFGLSLLLLVTSVAPLFPAQTAQATLYWNAWESLTPMSGIRMWTQAGVVNGKLYVVGGNAGGSGDGVTAVVEVYNPNSNTWDSRASMPDPVYGAALGVIDSKIYVAGGWNWPFSSLPQRSLSIYDVANDSWSRGANMPRSSGCSVGGVIDRDLYVLAGCDGTSGYRQRLYMYDPDTDVWTEKTQAPNAHADGAGAVIDGKFYVVGGIDSASAPSSQLDVYDPDTDQWTSLASMSEVRNGPIAEAIDGKLYVAGGAWSEGNETGTMGIYDPSTDQWDSALNMLTPRKLFASGVIDGLLYTVGGMASGTALAVLEVYDPSLDETGDDDHFEPTSEMEEIMALFESNLKNLVQDIDEAEQLGYDLSSLEALYAEMEPYIESVDAPTDEESFWEAYDIASSLLRELELELFSIKAQGLGLGGGANDDVMAEMREALDEVDEGMIMLSGFLLWLDEDFGADLSELEDEFSTVVQLFSNAQSYLNQRDAESFWEALDVVQTFIDEDFQEEFERVIMKSDVGKFFEQIGAELEAIDEEAARLEANGQRVPPSYDEIQTLNDIIGDTFDNAEFEKVTDMIDELVVLIDEFWAELGKDHTRAFEPPAGYEGEVVTLYNSNPFSDVDSTSLEGKAAAELYRRAVIGGFSDGEFKGDRPVNRAEAAKFLLLAAETKVQNLANAGRFWDVAEDQWYTPFVMTAAKLGIINGYSDGSFRPADTVNTAEFLKMMSVTFGLANNLGHSYRDVPTGIWFAKYVGIANSYGLFPDRARALLKPSKELTRAEVAIAIYQYLLDRVNQ